MTITHCNKVAFICVKRKKKTVQQSETQSMSCCIFKKEGGNLIVSIHLRKVLAQSNPILWFKQREHWYKHKETATSKKGCTGTPTAKTSGESLGGSVSLKETKGVQTGNGEKQTHLC